MRLADKVAQHGIGTIMYRSGAVDRADIDRCSYVAQQISTSRLLVADNVADAFYLSNQENFDIATDFPALVPPFPDLFIEWRMRNLPEAPGIVIGMGALVHCSEVDAAGKAAILEAYSFANRTPGIHTRGPAGLHDVRWLLSFTVVGEGPGNKNVMFPYYIQVAVDTNGTVFGSWPVGWRAGQADGWGPAIFPALMALSFMNCKNVSHREVQSPPKLNRARIKRGRRSLRPYFILEIEPLREALRRESGQPDSSLKKALSICRGHFKDYRQSGLFGKIKGIFWWDHHARGDANVGSIRKDYAIKIPEGSTA